MAFKHLACQTIAFLILLWAATSDITILFCACGSLNAKSLALWKSLAELSPGASPWSGPDWFKSLHCFIFYSSCHCSCRAHFQLLAHPREKESGRDTGLLAFKGNR